MKLKTASALFTAICVLPVLPVWAADAPEDRLEEVVKFRQKERDLVEKRVGVGAEPPDALNQADARLAAAKARLAKAKPAKP